MKLWAICICALLVSCYWEIESRDHHDHKANLEKLMACHQQLVESGNCTTTLTHSFEGSILIHEVNLSEKEKEIFLNNEELWLNIADNVRSFTYGEFEKRTQGEFFLKEALLIEPELQQIIYDLKDDYFDDFESYQNIALAYASYAGLMVKIYHHLNDGRSAWYNFLRKNNGDIIVIRSNATQYVGMIIDVLDAQIETIAKKEGKGEQDKRDLESLELKHAFYQKQLAFLNAADLEFDN